MDRPLTKFVRRLELRHALDERERAALLAIDARRVERKRRWDLVKPGETVGFACLVDDGIAGRAEVFADGRRSTTAIYVAGDMCDLHSVAVPKAGWAITALTDCAYYEVPHEAILAVFDGFPNVALALWRDTVADASAMSKWVSVLSRLSARERLAHLLVELQIRLSAVGLAPDGDLDIALTQDQFAELLGITPTHVYRTFRDLRDDGLILPDRASVRVLDPIGLRRIAKFDDHYLLTH